MFVLFAMEYENNSIENQCETKNITSDQVKSSNANIATNNINNTRKAYNLRVKSTRENNSLEWNKKCSRIEGDHNKNNNNNSNNNNNNSNNSNNKRKCTLSPLSKPRPAPLSKYRRKTANLRERCRMQELNDAFKRLQSVVPDIFSIPDTNKSSTSQQQSMAKLTKINTLKLAVNYISALTQILKQTDNNANSNANSSIKYGHNENDKPVIVVDTTSSDKSMPITNCPTNLIGQQVPNNTATNCNTYPSQFNLMDQPLTLAENYSNTKYDNQHYFRTNLINHHNTSDLLAHTPLLNNNHNLVIADNKCNKLPPNPNPNPNNDTNNNSSQLEDIFQDLEDIFFDDFGS